MIWRPHPGLRMWDTWMFQEGERYHLFTLTQPYSKAAWDRVCHAVTTDWLRWDERPDILTQDTQNPAAWDAGWTLTGSVFRVPDGYAMTYGACHSLGDLRDRLLGHHPGQRAGWQRVCLL